MVINRSSPVPLRPVVRLSRSPDWADVTPPTTYGHSVAIGLASLRRSHVRNCCTYRARLRRPVRLLKCPDRALLLRPGGLQRASRYPAAGAGTGFRRLSGRRRIPPSGDWASGNPTFALSCGSPGTPSRTPGHDRRLAGMLFSHLAFQPPVSHQIQRHLLSSLPAARAIQQCASWRTDYYGHSVAIGLAPLRRSHVRQCCTYQRDLGVPFVSFNALTGHRSSAPEDYSRFVMTLPQGPVPVPGVFPAGVPFAPSGDWA